VSQLGPKTSFLTFSDDNGQTYSQSQGSGINSGVDHQTVGGGPYRANATPPAPPNILYPNAIYYASQDAAVAQLARSDDGGQTFGPAVPMYTLAQCGGLHGHVKVAPDGTIYVPNKNCGGKQALVVSEITASPFRFVRFPAARPGPLATIPPLASTRTGSSTSPFRMATAARKSPSRRIAASHGHRRLTSGLLSA
jgi:hypothetical protein